MQPAVVRRAAAAARLMATSAGLVVDDEVVLSNSNRLTVRLFPCDTLAQVAPASDRESQFEIDLARRLVQAGCPVAALEPRVEPRVYECDGFLITLWTYYLPRTSHAVSTEDYVEALVRLHAGMRLVDVQVPHVTERVDSALQLVADRQRTPALGDAERRLLGDTLRDVRGEVERRGADQLLHGEPHPGNVLDTMNGVLFIDLETCCHGPVEFDLAHAPDEVGAAYPGADPDLLDQCRILVLAMIIMWRWDRHDQLPDAERLRIEWLGQLRAATTRRETNRR